MIWVGRPGIHGPGILNVGAPGVRIRGGWIPTFPLDDRFLTDEAAPLASPRTAEPGPGTLTITDTNEKLSIVDGKLTFATGGAGVGNPGAWGAQLARTAGRAVVALGNLSVNGMEVGWDSDTASVITDAFRFNTSSQVRAGGTTIDVMTLSTGVDYNAAIVQRSAGFAALVKGGAFTEWTLLWVGNSSTANMYPAVSAANTISVGTLDNFRVTDLPAPWNTDYGIATERLAGSVNAGTAFTHEADCLIEFEVTTLPSSGALQMFFRQQDASNKWEIRINSAGSFRLYEIVGGVATLRSTEASVVTNGDRIVIVADGTTVRGYYNNTLAWTYSSASNYQTETDGSFEITAGSGAVSDIISWPRQVSGAAKLYLDRVVAA